MAQTTYLDLYQGLYQIGHLDWKNGKVNYDQNYIRPVSGMDFNHIALSALTLKADSFYYCDSKIDVKIREAQFKEKSGLQVDQLYGRFVMDSVKLQLPDICLRTPYSQLQATVDMDMNAFDEVKPGKLMAQLKGTLGRSDLFLFAGDAFPDAMKKKWPFYPMKIEGSFKGNMQQASFSGLKLSLPTAFELSADGKLGNLTDMNRLKANVDLNARTYHLDFITAMFDPSLMQEIRVPSGIGIRGNIQADGSRYATRLAITEGRGRMRVDAKIDAKTRKDGSIHMSRLAYRA